MKQFSVIRIKLNSGEKLPVLVDRKTWIPKRLALRWIMKRRWQTQLSTLNGDIYSLRHIYEWSGSIGVDLDNWLTEGNVLSIQQIESLVEFLRNEAKNEDGNIVVSSFNTFLSIAKSFLLWSLHNHKRGGKKAVLSRREMQHEEVYIKALFQECKIPQPRKPNYKRKSLTKTQVKAIRDVIAPIQDDKGNLVFPQNGFTPITAMRNWLIFEICLSCGLRIGEVLKLKVTSIKDNSLLVLRFPDDPSDTRSYEPGVKTLERPVPVDPELSNAIQDYIKHIDRSGRQTTQDNLNHDYLFVSSRLPHSPLSLSRTQAIAKEIGQLSGVVDFTWHRLRHTNAESVFDDLEGHANRDDIINQRFGWTGNSSKTYTEQSRFRQASKVLRDYQKKEYH